MLDLKKECRGKTNGAWPEQAGNITRRMPALSAWADDFLCSEFICPEPCCHFMRISDHARTPEISSSARLPRRQWITAATCLVAAAGCRPRPEEAEESASDQAPRTDVPLRVLWMGTQSDADVLTRTWASISEQALAIRLVKPFRHNAAADADEDLTPLSSQEFIQQSAASDVLLYPVTLMAELVSMRRVIPLPRESVRDGNAADGIGGDDGALEPADRVGLPVALRLATSFAGEQMAAPLGAYLPALILGDAPGETPIPSWDEYTDFVASTGGRCSEPTAAGWAGVMYLWRLASCLQGTWLFERETLAPLLAQPEYVAILQQMRDAVQNTSPKFQNLDPGQIFRLVASGELEAGIGFPQGDAAASDDGSQDDSVMTFGNLPRAADAAARTVKDPSQSDAEDEMRQSRQRAMVDPFMLVGSMAAACRQTAAANAFLTWISGGQGSEPLYRSISSLVDIATPASHSSVDMDERYRAWLNTELARPGFVPPLQLAGASEYYAVLDEHVRACIFGTATAESACEQISNDWMRLHEKHDLANQRRMWRRAQAMG